MRTQLLMAGAAALALTALPATAQVLGGQIGGQITGTVNSVARVQPQTPPVSVPNVRTPTVSVPNVSTAGQVGGQVTGGVGVQAQTPGVGAVRNSVNGVRGTAQSAVSGVRDTATDAASGVRGAVGQADARVSGDVDASADARLRRGRASASADLEAGLMLHTSAGEMIGEIVDVTRNAAGQVTRIAVRTADGVVRSLPPASVSINGDVAVTQYSGVQVRNLPAD